MSRTAFTFKLTSQGTLGAEDYELWVTLSNKTNREAYLSEGDLSITEYQGNGFYSTHFELSDPLPRTIAARQTLRFRVHRGSALPERLREDRAYPNFRQRNRLWPDMVALASAEMVFLRPGVTITTSGTRRRLKPRGFFDMFQPREVIFDEIEIKDNVGVEVPTQQLTQSVEAELDLFVHMIGLYDKPARFTTRPEPVSQEDADRRGVWVP